MPGEGHGLGHGDVLSGCLGDEAGAQGVGGVVGGVEAGEGGALLDDEAHGLGGQGRAGGAGLGEAAEDRAAGGGLAGGAGGQGPGVEPGLQGLGGAADDGLVGVAPGAAGLVGFGHPHLVDPAAGLGAGVVEGGGGDLGAAPAAAGEGEQQQGAVAQAHRGIVTGGQQGFQRLAREGGLGVDLLGAAPGVAAAHARHQLAHAAVVAGVVQALQLVELGQHAHAVHQRGQRRRAEIRLVAGGHQRRVHGPGQLEHQAAGVVHALGVVHDELQHDGHRQRQRQALAVAHAEPGGPVAQTRAVAAHGVGRLALVEQRAHGGLAAGGQRVDDEQRRGIRPARQRQHDQVGGELSGIGHGGGPVGRRWCGQWCRRLYMISHVRCMIRYAKSSLLAISFNYR